MTNNDTKTKKKTVAEQLDEIKDDCAQLHAIVDEQNRTIAVMRAQIQHLNSVILPAAPKTVEPRQRFG